MKALIRIILTAIILFICIPTYSQEEAVDKEPKFEWTDDMYWDPPEELLLGLEEIGELATNRKALEITSVYALAAHGDYLYVYDRKLKKLLRFDSAGNFQMNVLPDDQILSGYLRSIDIDDTGRILLSDHRSLYVVTDGKLETIENLHQLSFPVWSEGNILGFNSYFNDRMEGIIKEATLDGKNLGTWGEPYREFDPDSMMLMLRPSIKRAGNKLLICENYFSGFAVIDRITKKQDVMTFNVPAFARRIAKSQASVKYSKDTNSNSYRVFPVFHDFNIIDDEVFLYVTGRKFLTVIQCDLSGKMQHVYRGLPSKGGGAMRFAVSKVDGEPRFFFVMSVRDGEDYKTKVEMYSPCDKVPTADDLKIAEKAKEGKEQPKKEESEEEKKRKAEIEAQRKAYDAYNKARQAADKAESEAEKRQIYYKLLEEYPGHQIGSYALKSAVGSEPSPEVAAEALAQLDEALPKAEEDTVITQYKLLRISLNSILGNAEAVRTDATELLEAEIRIRDYYTVIRSAPRVEDWQLLLETTDKALSLSDPQSIMKAYNGMSQKQAKELSDHYTCEFRKEKARALTQLGKIDEALVIFEDVSKNTACHYTGNYSNDLDQHWAEALHKAGKTEEAIDLLTPGVLFGGTDKKTEALQKIYAASGRSEEFEVYLAKKRTAMAKKIDDVQFYDYEKNPVKLSEKFGKATILTFWTPSS